MKKYFAPKICIVTSNTYPEITRTMELRTIQELKKNKSAKIFTKKVKGSFEIPYVISTLINEKKYEGFIAIGCIIKGQTPNFDFISNAITNAIMHLSITYKKPIGNAVITCLNKKQANERLNKGCEASIAVCDSLWRGVFIEK
jgi:6,7-dimethyl-8-ribityllumazine synthase